MFPNKVTITSNFHKKTEILTTYKRLEVSSLKTESNPRLHVQVKNFKHTDCKRGTQNSDMVLRFRIVVDGPAFYLQKYEIFFPDRNLWNYLDWISLKIAKWLQTWQANLQLCSQMCGTVSKLKVLHSGVETFLTLHSVLYFPQEEIKGLMFRVRRQALLESYPALVGTKAEMPHSEFEVQRSFCVCVQYKDPLCRHAESIRSKFVNRLLT